jgi:transcriptional regulator NrdR family protein
MRCPKCVGPTQVIDSRERTESNQKSRRRHCKNEECGYRFSTLEISLDEHESNAKHQAMRRIRSWGDEKVDAFLRLTER